MAAVAPASAGALDRAGAARKAANTRDLTRSPAVPATAQRPRIGDETRRALAPSPFAPAGFASPRVQEQVGFCPSRSPRWSQADYALRELARRADLECDTSAIRASDLWCDGFNALAARDYAVALVRVTFLDGARFEFADDPAVPAALVLEVRDRGDEEVVDLVAVDVARPTRFATLFGDATWLDAWSASAHVATRVGRPLRLHRHPLGWIAAGCVGSVLLEPARAWSELADLPGPVLAEDLDHARELARLTKGYLAPSRIRVPCRD